MSRVKNHFMHKGIELFTLFVLLRRLNTELLSSWGGIFDGFVSSLIMLKTEGFGSAPPFTLILENTDGRLHMIAIYQTQKSLS